MVVGAGPNGLVAANVLADAGWEVLVLEAQPEAGGAVRSGTVTETGFVHDRYSAFYPLALASPAMQAMGLEDWGVRFCHGPLVVAHPTLDGTCAVLSRDVEETAASLEAFAAGDGDAWRRWSAWWDPVGPRLVDALFRPFPPVRATARLLRSLGSPGEVARFAAFGVRSVREHATSEFRGAGAQRLLTGNALHADLHPSSPGGALFAWMLCGIGQQLGWPCVQGGAGNLTRALIARLRAGGGEVRCDSEVVRVDVCNGRARGVLTRGRHPGRGAPRRAGRCRRTSFVSSSRGRRAPTAPGAAWASTLQLRRQHGQGRLGAACTDPVGEQPGAAITGGAHHRRCRGAHAVV